MRLPEKGPLGLRRVSVAGVLGISVLLGAAGCGEKPPDPAAVNGPPFVHRVAPGTPLKFALVANATTRFWDLAQSGLNKFEQETGVKVTLFYPPHGRLEEQKQILDDLVVQGYNGVMISVVSPKEQTALIDQLARRLNVITLESDAPDSQRLACVGPRQYDTGRATGMAIARLLPSGGHIAVFAGELTAENVVQRLRGLQDTIRDLDIKIVSVNEDRTDLAKARQQVVAVLDTFPDLDLLVGLWSYNGGIIRDVLKARGKAGTIKVVAFVEEEETLQGIEEGTIECGVALTAFEGAYLGAGLLRDLALRGAVALPRDCVLNTGFVLVDRFNVREFREARARQSSY